jgi:hypothetical protein
MMLDWVQDMPVYMNRDSDLRDSKAESTCGYIGKELFNNTAGLMKHSRDNNRAKDLWTVAGRSQSLMGYQAMVSCGQSKAGEKLGGLLLLR